MAISSAGLGSNLDVNGIVTQLMALEQAPLTALTKKEAVFQAKISGLGSLKGALSALQTAASALVPTSGTTALKKFSIFKTAIADTAIASATTTSSAVAGAYSLEVTQLALQHRIATTTGVSSPFDINNGNKLIGGGGTLTLSLGSADGVTTSKTTSLTIVNDATPEDVRDAINAANTGVSATVVNGTAGKQLVLVSDSPGSDQSIKLSGITGLSYGVSGDADEFTQLQGAKGSIIKLGGITVNSTNNTVSSAIDGITLNLAKESVPGVATTLTVSRDTSSLTAGVSALVKAYNDVNTTATNLGNYNATSKQAGVLNGDNTLRSAQNILRAAITNVPSELSAAALQHLSDIGVSLQKDGTLTVDSTKLSTAINNNLAGVANLVSAFSNVLKTATDGLVGPTGTIAARTDGINASIKSLTKQEDAISARLTQIEARYRKQFTALDSLMSSMTTTSTYLTQQLANLPKSGSLN